MRLVWGMAALNRPLSAISRWGGLSIIIKIIDTGCHNDHHPHHYRHQSLVINIIAIIIVLNINRVLVIREMIKARVEGSTRQILNRLTYLAYPPSSICRHHHHIIATMKSPIITFNNIDMLGASSLHHHHCRIISPVSIRGDLCLGDQSTPPDVSCK